MVTCPECDGQIDIDEEELDEGDDLTCDECGALLRVAGLEPLELEVIDEDESDEEEAEPDEDEDEETWQ